MKKSLMVLTITVILAACLAACGGGGKIGTTGSGANKDATPPAVSYTTPTNHATGVTINSSVTVTFSEQIDPATINQQTFTINGIQGTVDYDQVSKTATLSHPDLNINTEYTATIAGGVKDLAGNAIAEAYTWTFTTSSTTDTVAPSILHWLPALTNVPINSALSAVFSEPMDISSINSAFTLREQTTSALVTGSIEYIGGTATFKPAANLKANTAYTANIATSASDLGGNGLDRANSSFTFTTGIIQDVTPPEIVSGSETPSNGSTGVPGTTSISIAFNEPVYPFLFGTIDGAPGTMSFDYVTNRVTLTPSQPLIQGKTYKSTIRAKDLAGNLMPDPFTWNFTVQQ